MDIQPGRLLQTVIGKLEQLGLRYFVTGSVAAIYYGEPRFTNDIDIVVDLTEESIPRLVAAFPPGEFYLSEEALRGALNRRGMCNILHIPTSLKVDLIVADDSLFNRSRFERSLRVKAGENSEANFASAEDVIVKKMDFFRQGGSEKHLRDITGIIMVSGDQLDHGYIENWADQMGLETIWRTIKYLCRQKRG